MSFKRKLSAALLSLALIGGTAVAGAAPANAGTSIGSTYNGASHIYYKFYASTNEFCIKQKVGRGYTANVAFYVNGNALIQLGTGVFDSWSCIDLDKYGKVESKRVTFKLYMMNSGGHVFRSSTGYAYA
ncbi:hypothetical protein [Glutamicibacter arilaitensis]|uniref:hypothetical protein n=1 Tax=Glutamicibacter arilaitensis TaxID=256701 RepID=UPI00384DB51E